MPATALRSDIALATFSLTVIAGLGAYVAFTSFEGARAALRGTEIAAAEVDQQPEYFEFRNSRGTRPLAVMSAAPRPIAEASPRRGSRAVMPPPPAGGSIEFPDAESSRSRR